MITPIICCVDIVCCLSSLVSRFLQVTYLFGKFENIYLEILQEFQQFLDLLTKLINYFIKVTL